MVDMLASFKKFKTYNRKHGKISKSNERKGTQSFLKSQSFGEYTQHQPGPGASSKYGEGWSNMKKLMWDGISLIPKSTTHFKLFVKSHDDSLAADENF